jgi:hypothetical protein
VTSFALLALALTQLALLLVRPLPALLLDELQLARSCCCIVALLIG